MRQRTADNLVDKLNKINRQLNASISEPLAPIRVREMMHQINLISQEILDTYDD